MSTLLSRKYIAPLLLFLLLDLAAAFASSVRLAWFPPASILQSG
jgi:hypothetical protein